MLLTGSVCRRAFEWVFLAYSRMSRHLCMIASSLGEGTVSYSHLQLNQNVSVPFYLPNPMRRTHDDAFN